METQLQQQARGVWIVARKSMDAQSAAFRNNGPLMSYKLEATSPDKLPEPLRSEVLRQLKAREQSP